jgi:WS/DGAT/MGAT family acyltransferase
MHVACTMLFEAGPLRTLDGGLDVQTVRKAVAAALVDIPCYRQKLARLPGTDSLFWVGDDRFSLDYHLRHTALPRPGGAEQLQQLSAWIMQQPLDRTRPLWEMWVVEGLAEDRFAVVSKVHHCMVDGVAGAELMQRLLSPDPQRPITECALPEPRPAPGTRALLASELGHRAALPASLLRAAARAAGPARLAERLRGFAEVLGRAVWPVTKAPWNGPLGPHRRLDWLASDLAEMRATSRRLGGTINDLVLATVAGAVRSALERAGVEPRDVRFRALAPVSVRSDDERGTLGNRVSLWVVDLPVGEASALGRLERIRVQTAVLKRSQSALAAKLLADAAEWTSSALLSVGARAAMRLPAFNMIVTNVPGPQIPLFLAGARLLEAYPVAPLFDGIGLNVALMSYAGRLYWGLDADYDRMPDLAAFRRDLEGALRELLQTARPRERRGAARPQPPAGSASPSSP